MLKADINFFLFANDKYRIYRYCCKMLIFKLFKNCYSSLLCFYINSIARKLRVNTLDSKMDKKICCLLWFQPFYPAISYLRIFLRRQLTWRVRNTKDLIKLFYIYWFSEEICPIISDIHWKRYTSGIAWLQNVFNILLS